MSDNICRFSLNQSSDLLCTNFVLETKQSQRKTQIGEKYLAAIVIGGNGTLRCEKNSFDLLPDMLFFVKKGWEFSVCGEEDFVYSYITFTGRRAVTPTEYIKNLNKRKDKTT